jgi:hypothetical protein
MSLRELVQLSSVALSLWLVVEVLIRVRRYRGLRCLYYGDTIKSWSAFIAIGLTTGVYYLAVWYDSYVKDVFIAGDWSAGLRLFVIMALIIHVHYQPRDLL